MDQTGILQVLLTCGVIYSLVTFILSIRKGDKNQTYTTVGIFISCTASFLSMTFY